MKKSEYPLIPYEVIEKAIEGDVNVVRQIIRRYKPYMNYFCKENWTYDENLVKQVETQLIYAITRFKIR